jgi:hypothetical protein
MRKVQATMILRADDGDGHGRPATCTHPSRAFHRKPWASGGREHVAELCVCCFANTRGAGVWVSRRELAALGIDVRQLPLAPSKQERAVQKSLFDATEP